MVIFLGNLHCRVHPGGGGAAYQQRLFHPTSFHFPGHMNHFVERWRNQAAQSDDVHSLFLCFVQDPVGRHHYTEIDDLIAVAAEYDSNDVLTNVVYITFDRGQ